MSPEAHDEARWPGPGDWLVLKYAHGGVWFTSTPGRYTFSLLEAGVFTEAEAKRRTCRSAGEEIAVEFGSQLCRDHLKRNNRLAEHQVLVALFNAQDSLAEAREVFHVD